MIFVLAIPDDHEWTTTLVNRLKINDYQVYFPSADTDNQAMAEALYKASMMLVVISQESVLGESADVFESWWRLFLDDSKPIVTVVKPGTPAGVENWMPFDLRHFPRVDFSSDDQYTALREAIDSQKRAVIHPVSVKLSEEPRLRPPVISPSIPVRTPPAQRPEIAPAQAAFAIEKAHERRRRRRMLRNFVLTPVVFVMLVLLWIIGLNIADHYGAVTALSMVTLATLIGTGITLAVMFWHGRRRKSYIDRNGVRQSGLSYPRAYIEVIASVHDEQVGEVIPLRRIRFTVGSGPQADLRIKDREIEPEHIALVYSPQDQQYVLQNLSNQSILLHDHPVNPTNMRLLTSGDLIVMGQSAVLQFRSGY